MTTTVLVAVSMNIKYKVKRQLRLILSIFLLISLMLTFAPVAMAAAVEGYEPVFEDDVLRIKGENGANFYNYYSTFYVKYFEIKGLSIGSLSEFTVTTEGDKGTEGYRAEFYITFPSEVSPVASFQLGACGTGMTYVGKTLGGKFNAEDNLLPTGTTETPDPGHYMTIQMSNGQAEETLYIGRGNKKYGSVTFHFSVAKSAQEVDPDSITEIKVTENPSKTDYVVGELFDPLGMVVQAVMDDGNEEPLEGYSWTPQGPLTLSDNSVTIIYGDKTASVPVKVSPRAALVDIHVKNGQLLVNYEKREMELVQHEDDRNAVIWYGEEKGEFELTVDRGAELLVNGEICTEENTRQSGDDLTVYTVYLNTNTNASYGDLSGERSTVTVRSGESEKTYRFTCFSQCFDRMPDEVTEYISIFSQYTNGGTGNILPEYGIGAVSTLRGANFDAIFPSGGYEKGGSALVGPYSVGNYGSYITYRYNEPVRNDPNNPYGIDLIISGNSYDGTSEFSEPGQVWVSKDGETWYALAGSVHYDNTVNWDYSVIYYSDGYISTDGGYTRTSAGANVAKFPSREFYPLFDWDRNLQNQDGGNIKSLAVSGIFLKSAAGTNEYGNVLPAMTSFGYADTGLCGLGEQFESTNDVFNPYPQGNAHYDVFDLDWAVDENGLPVHLDEISYIKVQCGVLINNKAIGEKSTELCGVIKQTPDESAAGRTAEADAIVVDGKPVALESGKDIYDVEVAGGFVVDVESEAENVYINSVYGKNVTFFSAPEHGIVRVILQSGQQEPRIYYLRLREADELPETKTVTLDGAGGKIGEWYDKDGVHTGQSTAVLTYDDGMVGAEFPTPWRNNYEFVGWLYNGQKYCTAFENWMDGITLTAVWREKTSQPPNDPGANSDIRISFRLIGSSFSDADVDLGEGEAGYHGAEYENWISTKTYTLSAGSTVLDLATAALNGAGLAYKNPSGNYITGIRGPGSEDFLEEMTNGPRSGWMYTLNGVHALSGVSQQKLSSGDTVILHYVNDYAYEVSDWDSLGGMGFPALGDGTFHDRWLSARDVPPGSGANPPGANPPENGRPSLTPAVTADENGGARAEIASEAVADGIAAAMAAGADGVTVAPDVRGGADRVTVELPGTSAGDIGGAGLDLTVETDLGGVTLPPAALEDLSKQSGGGSVSVSVEAKKDGGGRATGEIAIEVRAGEHTADRLPGGLKCRLPAPEDGNVLVILGPDGAETVVRKSVVEDGRVLALLDGSCTVKIADNSGDFTDVAEQDWFAEAAAFASGHELFEGVGGGRFAPDAAMTRGMLATVLWRLEDERESAAGPFADVAENSWYGAGIAWAGEHGIAEGYGGGRFGPEDGVTREQMAVMLWRYAGDLGMDVRAGGDLSGFTDGGAVSGYARDAVKWAVDAGLIQGRGAGILDPRGGATRAEAAAVLQRMVRMIVK